MSTGNKAVPDLPPIPDPIGGSLYIAKDNIDYKVDAGGAGGVATLGSDGKLVASQQPPLPFGYTPVQQGTGVGQLTNAVKIGWSAGSRLKATVDSTDLGNIVFDTQLGGYVPTSRTVLGGAGLTGGGALTVNETISMGTPSTIGSGSTNSASGTTHTHAITLNAADIPNLAATKITSGVLASAQLAGTYSNLVAITVTNVATAGQFKASATGSVTAPMYTFTTDSDTGIWSSGAGALDFTCNGVNRLDINGSGIVVAGAITASGNITGYSSDARLKTNIKNIEAPMEKLYKIGGYTFDWDTKKCFVAGFHPDNTHEHGVLAQEVQRVMPDAVTPASFDPNYLTVNYARLVPLLIECIKDLQSQIDELKKE